MTDEIEKIKHNYTETVPVLNPLKKDAAIHSQSSSEEMT